MQRVISRRQLDKFRQSLIDAEKRGGLSNELIHLPKEPRKWMKELCRMLEAGELEFISDGLVFIPGDEDCDA